MRKGKKGQPAHAKLGGPAAFCEAVANAVAADQGTSVPGTYIAVIAG